MAKIVTIGSICQDIFFPTSEGVVLETPDDLLSQKKVAFELGAKYPIEQRYESLGGNSINVAVGLAKLGEDVSAYTTIGDDMIGKWILKELEKTEVKTTLVKTEKDCGSDMSAIIVDGNSSDRVIFSSHIANKKLVFDAGRIGNPKWLFVGDLSGDWLKITDDILFAAKKRNINLAFNPRQKTIHENVGKVIETIAVSEILFVNKDEAIEIVDGSSYSAVRELMENEKYLSESLYKIGVAMVVITDGERGAWGYDGKNFLHVDAMLRKVVDTTGAGDAFTSGFFAAHVKELGLENALKWGIINSSSSIGEYGGQKGLLNQQKIMELASSIKVN